VSNFIATILSAALLFSELPPGTNPAATGSPVRMTVTANVDKNKRTPQVEKADVAVKQGKEQLQVLDWVPATGERAGLELFFRVSGCTLTTFAASSKHNRPPRKLELATRATPAWMCSRTSPPIVNWRPRPCVCP